MKFTIELSADELNELASLANELHEPMSKTGADVIRSYLRRPTQRAPDRVRILLFQSNTKTELTSRACQFCFIVQYGGN